MKTVVTVTKNGTLLKPQIYDSETKTLTNATDDTGTFGESNNPDKNGKTPFDSYDHEDSYIDWTEELNGGSNKASLIKGKRITS